jgi:PKD domain
MTRAFRILCLVVALVAILAADAVAASCERQNSPIFDGGGYIYDFTANAGAGYGQPVSGGSNGPGDTPPGPVRTTEAWAFWGNVLVFPPGADITNPLAANRYSGADDGCAFTLGGQEIIYPVARMQGLDVQHRWYVDPGPLNGARILTVLRNPSTVPVSATVVVGDPEGFDVLGSFTETTARATSDGTGVFSPASYWGVSTDEGGGQDPALAHVWGARGGAIAPSEVVLGNAFREDILYWAWNITVPPSQTFAFISYEIQAAVPGRSQAAEIAQAISQADARQKQPPASLYLGMSREEIAATRNWPHPPPSPAIAPVSKPNAARPVRLDGTSSTAAAGLPQCAIAGYAWKTDDRATANGPTLSHFFSPGRHKATLTVANDCGGAKSVETTFNVASGLKLGKVKLNRKAGTAKLQLSALGAGKLTLSGKGVKKQAKQLRKAGKASLTLKPTGKTLSALRRSGKAKIRLKVALLPKGGKASRASKTVTLKLG